MSRPCILQAYKATMIAHLKRKFGFSDEEADRRFRLACKDRYKPMTALVAENVNDGTPVLKAVDLVSYLDKHSGDLISPSGSIYCQHEIKLGATINMILAKLKKRKVLKKQMLKCKAIGDIVNELIAYFGQTLVKIGINALPGNYGSPYSIFYDKGNYNAITSTGRALIGFANTCIEHVLGGNFGWFTQDQLINHITIHLDKIDPKQVTKVLKRHGLRWVEADELLQFFKDELSIYHKYKSFKRIEEEVAKMTREEIQYFWYYQNLRHIVMGNDELFRPWFEEMFDLSLVKDDPNTKPEDLFALDGALVVMINVSFDSVVNSGNPEIQVYDLPNKMPEKAIKFVNIANHVKKHLDMVNDIFDAFIFTPMTVPDVENRKLMIRNSSVISDTDSVIFTVKDWVEWYTHDIYKISPGTYHIACTMIYWITQAVAHSLKIFSIAHGAKGDRVRDMQMKNEFLYPTMCLADIKKHYAGVVTVQEGVILPKPQPDIKGVQFKGSDICKDATQFAEKFIVNDILLGSLNNKISGRALINKIMKFEQEVYKDTVDGSVKWCEPEAIKEEAQYKKPYSSQWFYYLAWKEIFEWKYGEIILPTKCTTIPIATPTRPYFDWLHKNYPKVGKLFEEFVTKYKKSPSRLAISPITNEIPKEIIPLVMTRDIVYDNVKPVKLIMKQLGIDCGFEDDKLLFTEVYGDHKLLGRITNTTQKEN